MSSSPSGSHEGVVVSRAPSPTSSPWSSAPFPLTSGLVDTRINKIRPLIPPACLQEELPTPIATQSHIIRAREMASKIINGQDDRVLLVVGPCSIHDPEAALHYARMLKPLADQYSDDLFIVMRAYLEKPRTTVGWKGLINDPELVRSTCQHRVWPVCSIAHSPACHCASSLSLCLRRTVVTTSTVAFA